MAEEHEQIAQAIERRRQQEQTKLRPPGSRRRKEKPRQGGAESLTSRPTVRFSALHNPPLVLFCRPNSWRNQLEQIGAERKGSLNVALEADTLSLQTHIVSEGGVYALLGPFAIATASKDCRLQSSKLVDPVVTRHIALAMSRHGSLTLACRTVMQVAREIATSGAAGLRRTNSSKSRG
jgi:LysR family nitrogen assimilation transcriptional regulator